jgi:hypothetical protein
MARLHHAHQGRRLSGVCGTRVIPDYRSVSGNIDVAILRRGEGGVSHFLTVTHWQSKAANVPSPATSG